MLAEFTTPTIIPLMVFSTFLENLHAVYEIFKNSDRIPVREAACISYIAMENLPILLKAAGTTFSAYAEAKSRLQLQKE